VGVPSQRGLTLHGRFSGETTWRRGTRHRDLRVQANDHRPGLPRPTRFLLGTRSTMLLSISNFHGKGVRRTGQTAGSVRHADPARIAEADPAAFADLAATARSTGTAGPWRTDPAGGRNMWSSTTTGRRGHLDHGQRPRRAHPSPSPSPASGSRRACIFAALLGNTGVRPAGGARRSARMPHPAPSARWRTSWTPSPWPGASVQAGGRRQPRRVPNERGAGSGVVFPVEGDGRAECHRACRHRGCARGRRHGGSAGSS
jgi:hypothetical protein